MAVLPIFLLFVSGSSAWPLTDISEDILDSAQRNAIAKFSMSFPGTKWCGPGNTADSYEDLGVEAGADACCRAHDHCPDVISGFESKHNLTNKAFYTRLNCTCDEDFRQCLLEAKNNETTAGIIGKIYFDALGTQCFRDDYPIVKCKRKAGMFKSKCVEYEYNTNAEKQYQWFDVPTFEDQESRRVSENNLSETHYYEDIQD